MLSEWVQARYGQFAVPALPDLIGEAIRLYGEWAQDELNLLADVIQPGFVVVDGGAYIGTHTRAFSHMVGERGTVLAFEPNPKSYELLVMNIAAAPLCNIQAYNVGLSAEDEVRRLTSLDSANLGATSLSSEFGTLAVKVCPLDGISTPRPINVIKLDVEGMEAKVLSGAKLIVSQDRPIVFAEINSLEGAGALLEWAKKHEYIALACLVRAFNESNYKHETRNIFGDAKEASLLLIANEKLKQCSNITKRGNVIMVRTLDDLALVLFKKPQYIAEMLGRAAGDSSRPLVLGGGAQEAGTGCEERYSVEMMATISRLREEAALMRRKAYCSNRRLRAERTAKATFRRAFYPCVAEAQRLVSIYKSVLMPTSAKSYAGGEVASAPDNLVDSATNMSLEHAISELQCTLAILVQDAGRIRRQLRGRRELWREVAQLRAVNAKMERELEELSIAVTSGKSELEEGMNNLQRLYQDMQIIQSEPEYRVARAALVMRRAVWSQCFRILKSRFLSMSKGMSDKKRTKR